MSTQQELVEKYIVLRDKKAEIADEAKKKAAKINDMLTKIEARLLQHMNEQGVTSVKTEAGTFFKSRRTSTPVADWDAVLEYVKENDLWHMLERRVNKSAIEQFRDENDDLPPGVGWKEEVTVNVRRA